MKEMDDTDLVSRSYLMLYLKDLRDLRAALGSYSSVLLRLGIDTSIDTTKTIKPETMLKTISNTNDRNDLIYYSDLARTTALQTQISLESLSPTLGGIKDLDKFKQSHDSIKSVFTPPLEILSPYVFAMDAVFVENSVEKVLRKMELFLEQYSDLKL